MYIRRVWKFGTVFVSCTEASVRIPYAADYWRCLSLLLLVSPSSKYSFSYPLILPFTSVFNHFLFICYFMFCYVYLFIYLFVTLCFVMFICLFICYFMFCYVYLFIYLLLYVLLCLFVYLFVILCFVMFICLFIYLFVFLFNYLFIYSLINSFTFSINFITIRVTRLNVKDFSFLRKHFWLLCF
jgi:hypothetical protein